MMTRKGRVLVGAAITVACLLASGSWLMAQSTTASVQGTVRDASGGAIANAQVVLTSNTQGASFTATTDARGNYTFPVVRPDTYTLEISLAKFKTVKMVRVVVNANDKFNAGITTLEASERVEVITVMGRPPEVQANSGERSFTLESAVMTNIAVNGRSLMGLVALVPGVVPGVTQDGMTRDPLTTIGQFSANGTRQNSNNLTIDGITNVDTGDNNGNMVTTNLDTVAEFKVLTSSYQAEYGRAVGAQLQVVTKSGGQQFSGAAYWYARRGSWNANTWTNNRAGSARPEYKRNDKGANFGGPLYIPNKFNADKKKLFFFASVELQRRQEPAAGAQNVTVPTAAERQGDFSNSVDNLGNRYPYIRDYQLAQANPGWACNATDQRACFADGGVLGKIPASRLYAPSLAALSLYPLPNVTGQAGYNYTSQAANDTPRDEMMLRLDYHPSDNWRVMLRGMRNTDPQWFPYGVNWAAGANVPTLAGFRHQPGYNWMFSTNGMINSTTSLEIMIGSAHNSLEIGSDAAFLKRSNSAIKDLPMIYPSAVNEDFVPRFNYGTSRIGNPAGFYTNQAPFQNFNTTIDGVANLTKIAGAHVFKGGVYYQHSKKPQSPFSPFNGIIDFQANSGNAFDTGMAYGNAATGTFWSFQQASRYAYPMYQYYNVEGYIQDNWKATRRLTLDYGVRFYMMSPQGDTSGQISNFLPDTWSASAAPRLYTPYCVGASPCSGANRRGVDPTNPANTVDGSLIGRIVPGSGNVNNGSLQANAGSKNLFSGDAFVISPRFGFAYDITGKQSAILRGAFGIFYDRPQGNTRFNMVGNPPGVQTPTLSYGRFPELAAAIANASSVPPAPSGSDPSQYDFQLPTVYSWNVGAQFKLPKAFVWDISYVGNEQRKLLGKKYLNAVPYGAKYLAQNQDPTANQATCAHLGDCALPDNLLRPLQGYGSINMWGNYAMANYHALQTSLNRRFDNGLLVGINYTFSKTLGTANNDYYQVRIDGRDRQANYSILFNDRPHNFAANVVYQTPKIAGGAAGYLLNGWQISGVYRWMNGNPYQVNFTIPGVGAGALTGSDGNQNARIALVGDPGSGHGSDPYNQLNTAAFKAPNVNSIGVESPFYFVHAPGTDNLDLSLSKSFQLVGRAKFELRIDAFNALNHTQFFSVNNSAEFAGIDSTVINNLPNTPSRLRTGFGAIGDVWPARQMQIVGRFTF